MAAPVISFLKQFFKSGLIFCALSLLFSFCHCDKQVLKHSNENDTSMHSANTRKPKYLLYSVNPGEGFNLRRDVYLRVANLVRLLRQSEQDWILVLPPWGPLYHWKTPGIIREKIPWNLFFDVESLNGFIPVIEFQDFVVDVRPIIDEILYLQAYKEGWTSGTWEEKVDERECLEEPRYIKEQTSGLYESWFFGFDEVRAKNFRCVSAQGFASILAEPLRTNYSKVTSIMIDRAEVLLHDGYGDANYWKARRSMRFANHLRDIGNKFRRQSLNSDDERDKTELKKDWRTQKRNHGYAIGGPYISVHLRRRDFLYGHRNDVPSLNGTATQLKKVMQKYKLDVVFVATDAPEHEFEELRFYIPGAVRYVPSKQVLQKYGDGGVAIIDQWICAHARHFIGTSVSTFSFRIQEEREILGFNSNTTFNRFCGDGQDVCEQPSRWLIRY